MSKQLKEFLNGQLVGVSDGTDEEMAAHKLKRQEASPESTFEEVDTTAESEEKKNKEAKKLAAREALKNLQPAKGTNTATLRAEQNELRDLIKELLS